jgi:hypothetical protein
VGDLKAVQREHHAYRDHEAGPLVLRILRQENLQNHLALGSQLAKHDAVNRGERNRLAHPAAPALWLDAMAEKLQLSSAQRHILTVELAEQQAPRLRFSDAPSDAAGMRKLFVPRPQQQAV